MPRALWAKFLVSASLGISLIFVSSVSAQGPIIHSFFDQLAKETKASIFETLQKYEVIHETNLVRIKNLTQTISRELGRTIHNTRTAIRTPKSATALTENIVVPSQPKIISHSLAVATLPDSSSPIVTNASETDLGAETLSIQQLQSLVSQAVLLTQEVQKKKQLAQSTPSSLADLAASLETFKQQDNARYQALFQSIAGTNRINQLTSVTITSPTLQSLTLSDSDIPDTITVSSYLPLSGGNITGNLGIGTTTPGRNLGVVGNALITSTTTTSNLVIASSTTQINNVTYRWPSADGSSNQVLATDGSGTLSWNTSSSGGGGGSSTSTDWTFFNNSGTRLSTSTNQVLIGASATSTLHKLELIGSAFFSNQLMVGTTTVVSPYRLVIGGGLFAGGNITATGTLTVTDLAVFNGNASTTILSTTGNLLVNGFATTTGSNGNFATQGTLTIAGITGTSTIAAGQGFTVGTSQLVLQQGSGRLGIGTTTPQWLTQLAGTRPHLTFSDTNGGTDLKHWTFSSQGGNFYVATSSDAYATSTMPALAINSDGLLGFGTTSPSANHRISAAGDILANRLDLTGTTGTTTIAAGQSFSVGSGPFVINGGNNKMSFGTTTLANNFNFVGDNAGANVTMRLQNANSNTSSNAQFDLYSGTTNMGTFQCTASSCTIGSVGSGPFRLFSNNTERARFLSGGQLGIGTTTPVGLVNIHSSAMAQLVLTDSSASADYRSRYASTTLLGDFTLGSLSADTKTHNEHFRISALGRIGIGTTTPQWYMNIAGTSTRPLLALTDNNAGADLKHWTITSQGGNFYIATSSDAFASSSLSALTIDSNSLFGLGTTSPSANHRLSVQGNLLGSNLFYFSGTTGTSTIAEGQGLTVGASQFVVDGTSGNVGIGTTSPLYGFSVATTTMAFNANNDTLLTPFATTSSLLAARVDAAVTTANGYIYVIGGATTQGGAPTATVYFAKILSNGTLSKWQTTSAIPVASRRHEAVALNGYIYLLPNGVGGSVPLYAKINNDGTLGTWKTSNTLPFGYNSIDYTKSIVANGYIYTMGGADSTNGTSTVLYNKPNTDGSFGSWASTTGMIGGRVSSGIAAANGYIYIVGGLNYSGTLQRSVIYAKVNADGTLGNWTTNAYNVGQSVRYNSAVISNGTMYVLGGEYGGNTTASSTVSYARLNSDGSIGAFSTSTVSLLSPFKAHKSVVANGYIYTFGGQNDGGVGLSTVSYTSTPRSYFGTNIDLLGLASSTVGDVNGGNGSTGGSIFAGNIFSAGNLDVTGNTQLWNSLGVNGTLAISASSSLPQTNAIFSVTNATSASPILTTLYNGKVGLGTSTPNWQLQIAGSSTKPFLALSDTFAGADLKHWTFSSQGGNFYIATSSDALATSSVPAMMIDSNGLVGIGTSSPAARLSIEGRCIATLNNNALGCSDFAELYQSSEDVEPGDILAFDQNNPTFVKKAQPGDQEKLIGVVSTNPAVSIEGSSLQLLGGDFYKHQVRKPAVALSGRIPVKVNLDGGSINIGDPITISSEAGVGKKATQTSRIIGYALDSYQTASSSNQILVFANLAYWVNPNDTSTSSNTSNTSSTNDSLMATIINTVKGWLESMGVFVQQEVVQLKALIADKVTTKKLCVDDVCIEKTQLKALLDQANIAPVSDTPPPPAPETTESTTTPDSTPSTSSDSTSTDTSSTTPATP